MPGTLDALVLFLLATVPGYAHVRVVERRAPRRARSEFMELVDLLCVGLASSSAASLLVLMAGYLPGSPFLRLEPWAGQGDAYLSIHPWSAVWTGGAVLLASSVLSSALALALTRQPVGLVRPGSVWHAILGRTQDGVPPFVAVELRDGRVFEGFVGAFGTDDAGQRDDLGLREPLFVRSPDRRERRPLAGRFLILARQQILSVQAMHVTRTSSAVPTRRLDAEHAGPSEPGRDAAVPTPAAEGHPGRR